MFGDGFGSSVIVCFGFKGIEQIVIIGSFIFKVEFGKGEVEYGGY